MDGIQSYLKQSGVHCVDMDIANVGSQGELKERSDLSSDHLWEIILNDTYPHGPSEGPVVRYSVYHLFKGPGSSAGTTSLQGS